MNWLKILFGAIVIIILCGLLTTILLNAGNNTKKDSGISNNRYFQTTPSFDTDWSMVAAGREHTVALKSNGTLWGWGNNSCYQLGLGYDSFNIQTPIQVNTATDWASIATGYWHTVAIKNDRTIWAWGDNDGAQLGAGDQKSRSSPTPVDTDNDWSVAVGGERHTLARKINGTLWGCSQTSWSQINQSSVKCEYIPIQIDKDSSWVSMAGGANHIVALKENGSLWVCGFNSYGQLGLDDTTNQELLTQVGIDSDWITIAAGDKHTIAIKSNGTLWIWGGSYYVDKLGSSSYGFAYGLKPCQVGKDTDWLTAAAGSNHFVALKNNGTLWSWGYNYYGQLGFGDTISRTSPTQIGTNSDWAKIACGYNHSVALKTNGTLWAWGYNSNNELGLCDTISRTTPTQVLINKNYIPPSKIIYPEVVKSTKPSEEWGKIDNGLQCKIRPARSVYKAGKINDDNQPELFVSFRNVSDIPLTVIYFNMGNTPLFNIEVIRRGENSDCGPHGYSGSLFSWLKITLKPGEIQEIKTKLWPNGGALKEGHYDCRLIESVTPRNIKKEFLGQFNKFDNIFYSESLDSDRHQEVRNRDEQEKKLPFWTGLITSNTVTIEVKSGNQVK